MAPAGGLGQLRLVDGLTLMPQSPCLGPHLASRVLGEAVALRVVNTKLLDQDLHTFLLPQLGGDLPLPNNDGRFAVRAQDQPPVAR